jgi:hypothetical protein
MRSSSAADPKIGSDQALPAVLFVADLAKLLNLSQLTVRFYAGNREKWGQMLSPFFKLPSSRRLCWYATDVQTWLDDARSKSLTVKRRRRGRPTKKEQVEGATS